MPNGEFRPSTNGARVSATPSPSASRSSVMRFALGIAGAGASHHLLHDPALDALAVLRALRRIGLGHQHVAVGQHLAASAGAPGRVANALTRMPLAATGVLPAGQRWPARCARWAARSCSGGGSWGCGPSPAVGGSRAVSPQLARPTAGERAARRRSDARTRLWSLVCTSVRTPCRCGNPHTAGGASTAEPAGQAVAPQPSAARPAACVAVPQQRAAVDASTRMRAAAGRRRRAPSRRRRSAASSDRVQRRCRPSSAATVALQASALRVEPGHRTRATSPARTGDAGRAWPAPIATIVNGSGAASRDAPRCAHTMAAEPASSASPLPTAAPRSGRRGARAAGRRRLPCDTWTCANSSDSEHRGIDHQQRSPMAHQRMAWRGRAARPAPRRRAPIAPRRRAGGAVEPPGPGHDADDGQHAAGPRRPASSRQSAAGRSRPCRPPRAAAASRRPAAAAHARSSARVARARDQRLAAAGHGAGQPVRAGRHLVRQRRPVPQRLARRDLRHAARAVVAAGQPFERGAAPRVAVLALAAPQRARQVDEAQRQRRRPARRRRRSTAGSSRVQPELGVHRCATRRGMPSSPADVHRKEREVEADEHQPEDPARRALATCGGRRPAAPSGRARRTAGTPCRRSTRSAGARRRSACRGPASRRAAPRPSRRSGRRARTARRKPSRNSALALQRTRPLASSVAIHANTCTPLGIATAMLAADASAQRAAAPARR